MELNWSTFVIEIINFLVLVWILKRFLYQPVLDAVARRRAAIEKQLAEAQQHHVDAEELKRRYENRLSDWEQERLQAIEKLNNELENNRVLQLEKLKQELAKEAEKIQVMRARQEKQKTSEIEQRALSQSAEFASRLLSVAAGPELENRLFDLLLEGIACMPEEQINVLDKKTSDAPEFIRVTSAYSLTADKRDKLEADLISVTGLSLPVHYEVDTTLLAGLEIIIGDWSLQLNVRDELQGFIAFADNER